MGAASPRERGSSPNPKEVDLDLEEELGIVETAIGRALDSFDPVANMVNRTGNERPVAVCQDSGQLGPKVPSEAKKGSIRLRTKRRQ